MFVKKKIKKLLMALEDESRIESGAELLTA